MGDYPPILLYNDDMLSRECTAVYIKEYWRDAAI
jgi:hypothetical protein